MTSDCPFCARIERAQYNGITGADIAWFEPLNPVVPGHMLFVPSWHVEHGMEGSPRAVGAAMETAARYANACKESFNLITSFGSAATQTVPHIHCHYVPRRPGDELALPWTGQHARHGS
jgi:histidine triad (HIT) family protein